MKVTYIYVALIIVVIAGLVTVRHYSDKSSVDLTTKYDSFAQCLGDAGAKFYGAFWCPHCKDQKALFENSKKLPYIECSTSDGQGQTKECKDAGVTSYPTWILKDGTTLDGVQQLAQLAEKTSCTLPTP